MPTLRAHVMTLVTLTERLALFVRFEVASLLLGGNTVGSRVPNPSPTVTDELWLDLTIGLHFRLL